MIDALKYPPIEYDRVHWLHKSGVPAKTLARLMANSPLRIATGRRADDGLFEDDDAGNAFLVFEEPEDLIFWQPRTGEVARALNRAFALGEEAIYNPGTYSFDCNLNIFSSPLDWLRNRCDGCVVIDWHRAFDRLRDAPRVAISEDLLFLYKRHMRPPQLPEVSVIATQNKAVAA